MPDTNGHTSAEQRAHSSGDLAAPTTHSSGEPHTDFHAIKPGKDDKGAPLDDVLDRMAEKDPEFASELAEIRQADTVGAEIPASQNATDSGGNTCSALAGIPASDTGYAIAPVPARQKDGKGIGQSLSLGNAERKTHTDSSLTACGNKRWSPCR